jgi:hypothetical protein
MGVLALILGILGGLCAVMSIILAAGAVELDLAGFTGTYWLSLAAVLFLAAIASLLGRGSSE